MPARESSLLTEEPNAAVFLDDDRILRCEGAWTLQELEELERGLAAIPWPDQAELVCDAARISAMDTGGAWLLLRTQHAFQRKGRHMTLRGLCAEHAALMEMVAKGWSSVAAKTTIPVPGWLERLGRFMWCRLPMAQRGLSFLGESAATLWFLARHPRSIRRRALLGSLQTDGFNAMPIIGLLTFLMGVVIAFQGAEQLRTFGANIFIVDLVGISLLREIAPIVTAILVAGRSGSAYAAQIGTMKVTEELDAIRTLGLSPMQLLVIPKVLALLLALPLLTVYADVVGVFGGMLIAASELNVSFTEFLSRFEEAVALRHFLIGVGKAPVFAVIIALVGCYQGFQISGGVDSVGRHTTISVVQGIFLIIVLDAFFSVLLSWWGW